MNNSISNRIGSNIAIGIVVYFPEKNIIDKIKLAEESGFMLYIFDNSPNISLTRDFCLKLKNCKYITCGKNVGLGFAISSVCSQAYYDFYSALLFFDQDTNFNSDTLSFIKSFYARNTKLEISYSAIVFNSKKFEKNQKVDYSEIKDVLMAISSGSLFFLKNLEILNWHNINYFVDCVDYEFCLNSNNHHFKIGEFSSTPGFDHQTGQADEKYSFFGIDLFMRKYSKKRLFDYISASFKLFIQSIKTMNFKFANAIFRSLVIYIYFQIVIRIVKIYK